MGEAQQGQLLRFAHGGSSRPDSKPSRRQAASGGTSLTLGRRLHRPQDTANGTQCFEGTAQQAPQGSNEEAVRVTSPGRVFELCERKRAVSCYLRRSSERRPLR